MWPATQLGGQIVVAHWKSAWWKWGFRGGEVLILWENFCNQSQSILSWDYCSQSSSWERVQMYPLPQNLQNQTEPLTPCEREAQGLNLFGRCSNEMIKQMFSWNDQADDLMKWSRNVLSDQVQRKVNCGDYQECAADEYSCENLCSSSLRCNNLMNVLLRGICFSAVCYLSWMVDIYILLSATIAATAVTNICRSQPLLSDASSEAGGGWRGRSRGGGVHKAAPTVQYCQPWTMHHVKERKVAICSRL